MSIVTNYATQNWLITPAALAHNEAIPPNAVDQNFLLFLSGVVVSDFHGTQTNDWTHETITIFPNVIPALQYAISRWGIPQLPQLDPHDLAISVTGLTSFAAVSSIYSSGAPIAGYAVDTWRPTPSPANLVDLFNRPVGTLFSGIDVDLSVIDNKADLMRVSYQITLEGKLMFCRR